MSDYHDIVWLASYPKSGNTWVRAFLEAYYLDDLDLNELLVTTSDDMALMHQVGDGGKDIKDEDIQIQNLMRPAAMLRIVRLARMANTGFPLFIKTHRPHLINNGIETFPEALNKAVIHLVRDPRDVLPSYTKHMGCDLDTGVQWMTDKYRHLAGNAVRIGELISSWKDHTSSFLNADTHNVMTFQYEDLRADPVGQFSKMLSHAGVDPDMARVRHAVDRCDLARLRRLEKEKGFKESSPHAKDQFFGSGLVGGWKDKIAPRHAVALEKHAGRVMKRLGYTHKSKAA